MSDSPNIIISEMTAEKLRKELIDIRKWYANYEGEKEIKLVKAGSGQFGYPDVLEWTTVEELEGILDSGTFEEWQQQFLPITHKMDAEQWAKENKEEYAKAMADDSDYLKEDYAQSKPKFRRLSRKEGGTRHGTFIEDNTPEQRKAYLSAKNKAKNRKKNKASRANRRKNK